MGRERIKIDFLIHDLKVPIAVIEAGIISLLNRREKYGSLTEQQEKVLRRALRNNNVIKALVNDALELGKSRQGIINAVNFRLSSLIEGALVEIFDLAHCNTSEEIRHCVGLGALKKLLEERGVQLFIDEGLWSQEVCLDEAKVRQILRNLLNNALKYRKDRVELVVEKRDGYLIISVKDDGEGIPSLYHEKIFESYFQIDASENCCVRGHGLGLAGVMVLIEDMGGRIFLESDEGKGAKFSVEVPLMDIT
jgi:two-component system OmpR family sensor kinase